MQMRELFDADRQQRRTDPVLFLWGHNVSPALPGLGLIDKILKLAKVLHCPGVAE